MSNVTVRRSGKAHLLDFEIAPEEFEFLAQRDLLHVAAIQRAAEQFAEADDHAVGRVGILVDERGDGVERIEQEVRIDLHAQGLQAGLDEFGGERRRLAFALAVGLVVVPAEIAQHDDPVFEDVRERVGNQQFSEQVIEGEDLARLHGTLAGFEPGNEGDVRHRKHQRAEHVREEPAGAASGFMAHPAAEPEDGQRANRVGEHLLERTPEGQRPGDGFVPDLLRDEDFNRRQHAQHHPHPDVEADATPMLDDP